MLFKVPKISSPTVIEVTVSYPAVASVYIPIQNDGSYTLNWFCSESLSSDWLRCSPTSGQIAKGSKTDVLITVFSGRVSLMCFINYY